MNVIKATDDAVNAIRKMSSITRSLGSTSSRKQSGFIAEISNGYSGPFMVTWLQKGIVHIGAPPEFVGGSDYAGSILAPDMQVIKHISSTNESFTEGQENTLLVLKVTWFDDGDVLASFNFVPDPWKTCSEENRFITIDHLNPKTEQYPYRNPYIAIYPIARIEGIKIAQIQRGHIVEYNRWWRV